MSAKFDLPSELAKLETELRQQVPQGSEVNRDELMYQAGWAAAEVARKLRWGWPATSGVLAASVAVLAFFLVTGSEQLPVAKVEIEQVEPVVEESLPNLVQTREKPVRIVPAGNWQTDFSALARRHHLKDWDSSDHDITEVATSEVKTMRTLLRDFLTESGWEEQSEFEKRGNQGHLFDGKGML